MIVLKTNSSISANVLPLGDVAKKHTRIIKIFLKKGGFVFNAHCDDLKKPIDKILFTEACADMQNASFLETCKKEGNFIVNPELCSDSIV